MKSVPLKELCQIKHGGTPSKANPAFWQGSIPWVSPKDMKLTALADAKDHISQEAVDSSATSIVPEQSILVVARSGILAHSLPVAQVKRALAFNRDIKALIPDSSKIDPDFLFWFVRGQERGLLARGVKKGATVHSLQSGALENLLVPLPSREAQRHIVDLLSRAEGIVRLRREAQKTAAKIIPALFLDMFGDPAPNPKQWSVERLGDVANVVSGITKGRKLNGKPTRSVPYLRVANVQAGFLNLCEMKEIEATDAEIKDLKLQTGDIVLTEGGDYDKLGRGAQWRGEIEPCIHQNHIFRVRLRRDIAEPDYFEAYLQTAAASRYFLSVAKRTTNLASINMTQLRNLPVTLPTIESQRAFVQRARQVRSIQLQERTATLAAEATFNAVLARVFSQHGPLVTARSEERAALA